jgi:hypothetical protein
MPDGDDESKARKERTKRNLIYASDLAKSNTVFMVTAHTKGMIRFRLWNVKIEDLQEGCEDLVQLFMNHGSQQIQLDDSEGVANTFPLSVEGRIRILEHGLEESTISGTVVNTLWERMRTFAPVELSLTVLGVVLAIVFWALSWRGTGSGLGLVPHWERFTTAMMTTAIVSGISLVHLVRRSKPPIRWSVSYEREP